jgi:hypothetical protein
MRFLALLMLCLCYTVASQAQSQYVPLNHFSYHNVDRLNIKYGKILPIVHTVIKPYKRVTVANLPDTLSVNNVSLNKRDQYNVRNMMWDSDEWLEDTVIKSRNPILKFFYQDPATFLGVNSKGFVVKVNPVLQLELGKEFGGDPNELIFKNTRGVELRGSIKKRLSFYTFITDNQSRGMQYVRRHIQDDEAVPGNGYWKTFRVSAVDHFAARGYINFNLLDHIDIQFGHDKHFWGNGYRSLFLSDYGNSMFFLKVQTTIWRISYTNLFTEMTATYDRGGDKLLPKKYAAFHHLNFHVSHWLDVGLFETVIFERENGFEFQYLNPIIFYRAIEQSLGSPDNSLLGLDFKANIARRFQLYGQFLLDEFNFGQIVKVNGWWANKFSIQSGLKYIDAFGIVNLDLQGEVNIVRPFTYTHNTTATTYTHYNQPLAHPLGANFWELVGIARYQLLPELTAQMTFVYYQKGLDSIGQNWGGNIFVSNVDDNRELTVEQEFGNKIAQGVKQKVALLDLLISYQAFHNLFVDLNVMYRASKSAIARYDGSQAYVGLGVRLNMAWRGNYF